MNTATCCICILRGRIRNLDAGVKTVWQGFKGDVIWPFKKIGNSGSPTGTAARVTARHAGVQTLNVPGVQRAVTLPEQGRWTQSPPAAVTVLHWQPEVFNLKVSSSSWCTVTHQAGTA
eukprot:3607424-Rhodomonas_salina.1